MACCRRSDVENRIIPTTWRENGIGIFGDSGDISYKAYVVNGLDGKDFTAKGLRGGRQKGSKALAEDLAFVARVDWEPTPGVVLGGSLYHGNSGQDLGIDVTTDIIEGHFDVRRGPLQIRGLIVQAELDDVAALNRATATPGDDGLSPMNADIDSIGERMIGGYRSGTGHLGLAPRGLRDQRHALCARRTVQHAGQHPDRIQSL